MSDQHQKRYHWQHTWGDERGRDGKRHQDFAGYDDGAYIGRIRLELNNLKKGWWHWAGAHPKPFRGDPVMPNAGYLPTAAEAAQMVERYWDEMKSRQRKNPAAEATGSR